MYFVCTARNCCDYCPHVVFIFTKCKVRADEHGNAHCCDGSPLWFNRSTIFSSVKMKTILAEASPVPAVSVKIPCVQSLLFFPRRGGKALECFDWKRKLRSHGTMQGSVYGYSEDTATEDHHLLHQISSPRSPHAARSRCQLPAGTDIIPLSDTNMAVFISHCLHFTAFHVPPIPIIQFSPKVLTTRIAVSRSRDLSRTQYLWTVKVGCHHPVVGISHGWSCCALYPAL